VSWAQRYGTPLWAFLASVGRRELAMSEDCAQHDLHLECGEAGAEAASESSAEREPGEQVWCASAEEPFGSELVWLAVGVGSAVS
jgi:hypothetical protein